MPINQGYIELGGTADLDVKIYYDATYYAADPTRDSNQAPLINGPRGYCLDITNLTGSNVHVVVNGLAGKPQTYTIGQGNPVTTGAAKSLTAAQMAALGFTTRGNVGEIDVSIQ